MRLLLDSQAFLWFVTDDPRLSTTARAAIENAGNERLLSVASVWEMAIKHSIGKLALTDPFNQFIRNESATNCIEILAIDLDDVLAVATLPLHHRDPFDRLLIAQSTARKIPIVSSDQAMDQYSAKRIW